MSSCHPARLLLVLLAAPASGCISFCDGNDVVQLAAEQNVVAIYELGELGDPRVPPSYRAHPRMEVAFDTLAPALHSSDPNLRLTALEGLRHLSRRRPSLQRDRYGDIFAAPLRDPDPQIRWRAAWALGRLERASPGLRAATRDPHPRVAERAVWALGQAHDEEGLLELIAALDREQLVASRAVESLEKITSLEHGANTGAWKAWWRAWSRDRPPLRPR